MGTFQTFIFLLILLFFACLDDILDILSDDISFFISYFFKNALNQHHFIHL